MSSTQEPNARDHQMMRTGIGVDAHRFAPADSGRELWLAGLRWDGIGIEGDSDGDVAVHALIDALLSAAGLGDIGTVFGVGSHARGAGMHGVQMLGEVAQLLRDNNVEPVNASLVIVGNRPKLASRRAQAQEVLSAAAGCPVSVSATTTDGMGFTGAGEGLACTATALVIAHR